jgi:hypothetical protein
LATTSSVSNTAWSSSPGRQTVEDDHLVGALQEGHGVGQGAAALARVLPGDHDGLAVQVMPALRNHQHGPAGAHNHVGGIGRAAAVGTRARRDHDEVGGAGRARQRAVRIVLELAPFEVGAAGVAAERVSAACRLLAISSWTRATHSPAEAPRNGPAVAGAGSKVSAPRPIRRVPRSRASRPATSTRWEAARPGST